MLSAMLYICTLLIISIITLIIIIRSISAMCRAEKTVDNICWESLEAGASC